MIYTMTNMHIHTHTNTAILSVIPLLTQTESYKEQLSEILNCVVTLKMYTFTVRPASTLSPQSKWTAICKRESKEKTKLKRKNASQKDASKCDT